MERVKALINQLQQQAQQNAGAAVLLSTLQQIQLELTGGSSASKPLGTSKVAVVMPHAHARYMPPVAERADIVTVPEPDETPVAAAAPPAYHPPKPEPKPKEEKNHSLNNGNSNGWLFDPLRETPTLSQQPRVQNQNGKELNESLGNNGVSLNDKLKTETTELAERLNDSPIRELKKGIGINDRYLFVNELFRGDEVMYERSIKTINNFRILAEAEYWIDRELKVKLGWDDGKPTTQHFYQLVRRRFS